MNPQTICVLVKRRLGVAGVPSYLSLECFPVMVITDLLSQGILLEGLPDLAEDSEPLTTGDYGRRQKRITRNLGKRIHLDGQFLTIANFPNLSEIRSYHA